MARRSSSSPTITRPPSSRAAPCIWRRASCSSRRLRRRGGLAMTRSGFVIANLFRKRTRTILTLLSVIMAFLLFGLLQSVNHIFNAGADFVGATRLMTQARVSFTSPLPISMVPKLEAVPGVARVAYSQWFGGVWQTNTQVFTFAIDPQRYHDVYPEFVMPEEQWKAFADTRTAM